MSNDELELSQDGAYVLGGKRLLCHACAKLLKPGDGMIDIDQGLDEMRQSQRRVYLDGPNKTPYSELGPMGCELMRVFLEEQIRHYSCELMELNRLAPPARVPSDKDQ
jgi:hypothetical protein